MIIFLTKYDDGNRALLQASGSLTIPNLPEAKLFFAGMTGARKSIALDLARVEDIDTAGFQFLLVLKKDAERKGSKMKLLNHTSKILRFIEIYGVAGLFGDKLVLPRGEHAEGRFRYGIAKGTFL